jgi:hypothetical protein
MTFIAGGDSGHLGSAIAHTAERVAAFVRSSDREAYERELDKSRPKPEVTKTKTQILGEQYAAQHKAEEAQKNAERARLIAEGKIIINPDGSETHRMRGLKY